MVEFVDPGGGSGGRDPWLVPSVSLWAGWGALGGLRPVFVGRGAHLLTRRASQAGGASNRVLEGPTDALLLQAHPPGSGGLAGDLWGQRGGVGGGGCTGRQNRTMARSESRRADRRLPDMGSAAHAQGL